MEQRSGASRGRFGGFDILRILAALAVILSHSYAISGHRADQIAFHVGHHRVPLGSLGVSIFFVVSGFLVAGSWNRLRNARTFAWHRFARIWPAITVVIVLTVFVLGPLTTTVDLRSYFTSSRTVLYLGRNVVLFAGTVNKLPGVFVTHPITSVNGSLWTLTYEVWAYVAVLVLGMVGALRRWWAPTAVLVMLLLVFRVVVYDGAGDMPITRSVVGLTMADGSELWAFFFAGVVLSRIVLTIHPRQFLLPGAVALGAAFAIGEPVLYVLGLSVLVIGIGAFRGRVTEAVHAIGDPSYGVYIVAFPVQQLLYGAGVTTPIAMFVAAGAISLALGYTSWHLLERPVLEWAKRRPVPVHSS